MYSFTSPVGPLILWPFIILIIIAFLIWTEDGSQNLWNPAAHHRSPSVLESDSISSILQKTRIATNNRGNVVGWRRAMLIAIVLTILTLLILVPYVFPHGFTIFGIATLFFLVMYFAFVDLQTRRIQPTVIRLEESLDRLEDRFKYKING